MAAHPDGIAQTLDTLKMSVRDKTGNSVITMWGNAVLPAAVQAAKLLESGFIQLTHVATKNNSLHSTPK